MLLVTLSVRPVGEPERAALAIVAGYLAQGPEAVHARLAGDAPLRALPREEALREISTGFGARENATWTLRTVEGKDFAAFHVRWPSGREERVLLRMRGGALYALGPDVARASTRAPVPQRPEARPAFWALAAMCILLGLGLRNRRMLSLALLASGLAFAVVAALPYLPRAETPPVPTVVNGPGPVRDDVLLEAGDFARMRAIGSRDAEAYYRDPTYESFRTAWLLEPKPREELVRDPELFALATNDLRVKSLVSFYSASEPARRSAVLGKNALPWPANAKASVCGERLRVEIGTATLEVPNGAALAPRDAQVVPATHGEQRRDALALREAQELLETRGTPSRMQLIRGVAALARHNRWADVLKLTEPNDLPPELLPVRVRALLRAGRVDDARALAEKKRTGDATDTLAIADAMSNAGQWSTAETLFRSVDGDQHAELVTIRLRQLELRRALATNSQTITTAHFDIRHDATINPAIASRIGDLLEAELARLLTKLPRVELRRVTVNVLRWEDFRGGITLSDHILGLYDGEILFPFAAVQQFKPEVVAVITHELAHAILAQATADNAPRWFQEGVATRMELVGRQENVFSDTPAALVLPVTLLDAVMEKNSDPSAYIVAQTFIRFLEDRYGVDAISKLAGEFARGTNSDDALTKLAGKSLDALNAEFREWGFHHNGDFVMNEPWPYRELYSPGIDPRIREGFRFQRRPR